MELRQQPMGLDTRIVSHHDHRAGGLERVPIRCVQIDQALRRGHEFFLLHHLFQSHQTGEIPDARFTRFSFPPRWHFDVLRGLDYFASVGAVQDDRFKDAMAIVDEREGEDGRWKLQNRWAGQEWFRMERGGQPSRWNTLRALRVRKWWEG